MLVNEQELMSKDFNEVCTFYLPIKKIEQDPNMCGGN